MTEWQRRAEHLADLLAEKGELRTAPWHRAVRTVPRHELVPSFYEQHDDGRWHALTGADATQREHWLNQVYSDKTLITGLADIPLPDRLGGRTFAVAVSSGTLPGLVIRMLEDLDIRDGNKVLEIGTGSGYNAALLSSRLGEANVFSVDLRPELVDQARERMATLGYHPTLAAVDGSTGLPEYAPYDRIIATCSVLTVPVAWIEQLAPGGIILTDIEGALWIGSLAKLRWTEELTVSGRFCSRDGSFMPLRHTLDINPIATQLIDTATGSTRSTEVHPAVLNNRHLPAAFFAQLHLPADTRRTQIVDGEQISTRLTSSDGSWCQVGHRLDGDGRYQVLGAGRDLWRSVEDAHDRYDRLNRPGWDRFGITATPDKQWVWLDHQDSLETWPLPAAWEER